MAASTMRSSAEHSGVYGWPLGTEQVILQQEAASAHGKAAGEVERERGPPSLPAPDRGP
jgi:hypothetical protein